jgi:hypothetical protein
LAASTEVFNTTLQIVLSTQNALRSTTGAINWPGAGSAAAAPAVAAQAAAHKATAQRQVNAKAWRW